jgi:hypothetical protein
MIERCTPEEALQRALKECEKGRPIECLVIMTDEDGSIVTIGSTSALSMRLGLLEMAKCHIYTDVAKMEG